jgi:integrase
MAQITQRGRNKWLVRVFLSRDGQGRRQFKTRTITGGRKDAERWAVEAERDRDLAGTGAAILSVTVGELLDDLLTDYRMNGKDHKSAEQLVRLHLRPTFGAMTAARLGSTDLQRFIEARLEAGAAPATVNRALAALRRAFNLGRKATPPKVARMPQFKLLPENNARQGFFEHSDYEAILRELPPHIQPILTFAYYTGCRRGEILKLRWSQVDLKTGVVRLPGSITKTGAGRIIPLTPEVVASLEMQKTRAMWHPTQDCVFCTEDGQPITDIGYPWVVACKRAGFVDADDRPTKLLHDCRRSAARNMVRSGTSEHTAMKVTGHKTRSIFDRYDIVTERDLLLAASRLSAHVQESAKANETTTEKSCHTMVTPAN